ncbi:putative reverse transcriptase domain-containing protein [Tanacetum coccineum]
MEKVGFVAYKLELPEELSRVHNTFHVSNLKKCHADEPLAVPLDGLNLDDKLHFVEEPVEIVGREVKRLKQSRIPLVKVRWNSKRGLEFTWEREDQFKKKHPHLFTKTSPSSSAASLVVAFDLLRDALSAIFGLSELKVYVDDIIFGSTKKELCIEFEKLMHYKFQMSSMGELTFFLGLQVKQKEDGIFISQDKYVADILRKFGFTDVNDWIIDVSYIIQARYYVCSQPKLGLWYPRDSPFDLVAYSHSDYVGARLDRKLTTGDLLTKALDVGSTLISPSQSMANLEFCDKHNMVAYLQKSEGSEGFHQIVDFLTASHIRHLKLEDSDGISDLPTTEIFEQLALMGSFQGIYWGGHSIVSNNAYSRSDLQGEGSTIPVESHHTPIVAPSTSKQHHSPTLRDFIRQETEDSQPSSPTQTHVAYEVASAGVDVRHGGAATTVSSLDT